VHLALPSRHDMSAVHLSTAKNLSTVQRVRKNPSQPLPLA
jgi:hypothetical protein